MHFHCPLCEEVSRGAEDHVVHAVSKHEYSLLHAEDFNRLIEVCQAVTERMHAEQQLLDAGEAQASEQGAEDPEVEVRTSRLVVPLESASFVM